ncbi:uridine kinase [Gracilimonas mengyeensis]|uniref:Uridine kinase n=1 Tax=Gracilimonas mengyeensis TaxID=1302730 RepID=A0A521BCW3_9BACT|nr:uridine kinase [Gracilimonas mengyeensis]SMO44889.1 uridine kinase [Gracilimonas mengyeensis]
MSNPLVIGVAGGSGSGKTTVVNYLCKEFSSDNILRIEHDSYYRELGHLPFEKRVNQNFDHPASLETELMIRHIKALMEGYPVEVPVYDFEQHTRKEETITATPSDVILIDGILIFSEPDLLDLMDVKIFVDTDDDVRLLRRLQRDIQERGRSVDSVLDQYQKFVRPMHLEFVEPSKRYADVIIPRGGKNKVALEMVTALIRGKMEGN